MQVQIETPGGSTSYDVHVIKINNYTINDIFDKELYFYIPFYIFTFEPSFGIIEKDKDRLEQLKDQYNDIVQRLDEACKNGKLTLYQESTILELSQIVLDAIAAKYKNIKKEVDVIMGGEVLDYPAKRILNQGRSEGRNEGIEEGIKVFVLDNIEENIPKERIIIKLQRRFDLSEEQAVAKYKKYSGELL